MRVRWGGLCFSERGFLPPPLPFFFIKLLIYSLKSMYLSIVSMYHLYLLLQFYIYRLSIYLSFYLSIQLSIYPSICISTYISVYCHERARLHVKKVHWYVYIYIYCLFNHFHKYHITGEMIRRIIQYWRGIFSIPVSLRITLRTGGFTEKVFSP